MKFSVRYNFQIVLVYSLKRAKLPLKNYGIIKLELLSEVLLNP